jgi:hypothetical protein
MYWSVKKMQTHADKYSKAFNLNEVKSDNPDYGRVSYADYIAEKFPDKDAWK